jgi:hypothetical protein
MSGATATAARETSDAEQRECAWSGDSDVGEYNVGWGRTCP